MFARKTASVLVQCCRRRRKSSSLLCFTDSIFIWSLTVKYTLHFFFFLITPFSIPSLTIKEKPFIGALPKSRCDFFSPFLFFFMPNDEHFEKKHRIWIHEQIYLGTCFLKERKTEKWINGRGAAWLLETALFTSMFFQSILLLFS